MTMIASKRKWVRVTALVLLFQTLQQIVSPLVANALTAGPTAPEATSFEPVDTTDMVNLQSGDFTYNIPLLEVPGPEGGYPLSLSYHAGIQPNEEASWVGLGWTLNPGAITRNVNGYADDFKQVSNIVRDYWEGGESKTYNVGVSIGPAGSPASVSAGLSFSQDTYQGFGMGASVGLALGIKKTPFQGSVRLGIQPFGGGYYASAGISGSIGDAQKTSFGLSGGVGISTNFQSVGFQGSLGLNGKGMSLMDVSMSSAGKPSLSIGGGSASVNNQNIGKISTYNESMGLGIPVYPGVFVNLGYEYQRYWSDEKSDVLTNGVLYYPSPSQVSDFDKNAFDTYSLLDIDQSMVDNSEPEKALGGSFPEYDNFYVASQGLSGSMRPYMFRKKLLRQNRKKDNTYFIKQYNYRHLANWQNTAKVGFRFDNDFSNKFLYEGGTFAYYSEGDAPLGEDYFVADPETGLYSQAVNRLDGSKHIEWFSNNEIAIGQATAQGFIKTSSTGLCSNCGSDAKYKDLIGGFMITNESGVTYHYALPAYSYDEFTYTESVKRSPLDNNKPESFNTLTRPAPYAYTWYLTAITGPDFVDKNNNGLADEQDWGYWVNFNYGKWADAYQWRNPFEGFNKDIDNNFQSYSTGKKEVYYLDAIQTRTHSALFIKELRNDAQSASMITSYDPNHYPSMVAQPRASLRLNEILLLNNSSLQQITNSTNLASALNNIKSKTSDYYHTWSWDNRSEIIHDGTRVIDKFDMEAFNNVFTTSSIRKIVLSTAYSLLDQTVNSYPRLDTYNPNLKKTGKLTLNTLKFLGKGGADITPAMNFEYDLSSSEKKTEAIFLASLDIPTATGTINGATSFEPGDIFTFTSNQIVYYGLVLKRLSASTHSIKYLNALPTGISSYQTATTTKNPLYNKDNYDMWGMYKSDYQNLGNENLSRMVTELSSQSLDVWSLRHITTPTGAKVHIRYQADSYSNPVLAKNSLLRIKSLEPLTAKRMKITFWESENIAELLKTGNKYSSIMYVGYKRTSDKFFCDKNANNTFLQNCSPYQSAAVASGASHSYRIENASQMLITELGANYAIFTDDNFYDQLTSRKDITNPFWTSVNCENQQTSYPCKYISQTFPETLIGGYLLSTANTETKGGGIRVVSIALENNGSIKSTNYNYNIANTTSGVTSYEPFKVLEPQIKLPNDFESISASAAEAVPYYAKALRDHVWSSYSNLLMISRELPAPGVMYEYVTVQEKVQNTGQTQATEVPGKLTYQFEVFNENMVQRKVLANQEYNLIDNNVQGIPLENGNHIKTRRMALEDYTSRIGSLKRMISYDEKGNKLTETINHYLHDTNPQSSAYKNALKNQFNNQGVIQENFADARFVKQNDGKYDLLGVMSRREQYPSIQTGTTTINYKTGLTEQAQNLAFDFYSGALTQSLMTDGYGNRWKSVSVPAYVKYPQMGLKQANSLNKHMLTQTAASYIYQVDQNNNPIGILSAGVQTWGNDVNVLDGINQVKGRQNQVWRKKASYSFVPVGVSFNGITPVNQFSEFNFANPEVNSPWQKNSEITLYDYYSKALQAMDINNNVAATKMGYLQTRVINSANLANYYEIAFSGAEDEQANGYFGGGVMIRPQGVDPALVTTVSSPIHTGHKSLKLSGQQSGFIYKTTISEEKLQNGRKYIARVWVRNAINDLDANLPSQARLYYKLNGKVVLSDAPVEGKKSNGWYLLSLSVPVEGSGEVEVGCLNQGSSALYFDDFRFQPQNSIMTAFVYDSFSGEVSYILDNNNMYTHYRYDAAGRLITSFRETFQYGVSKIQEVKYNYARQ